MTGFPDLVSILVNVGKVLPAIIMVLQGVCTLIGLYFVASALIELWGVTHDNALKYIPGRERFSIGSALITLSIGSILLSLGTLELVGILSRTITGDYANSRMAALSYSGGSSVSEKTELAAAALLGVMEVVGFVAMIRGWILVNRYYNNHYNSGIGIAIGYIIGGVLAWNFKWFADIVNNTLGFNVIKLFSPF